MKTHTSSFAIAALASLALVGCSKGSSGSGPNVSGANGNVAIVNGEPISMDEYYRYLERKSTVQVAAQQPLQLQPGQVGEMQVAAPLGFQAMRDLINRRLLLDVARDEKVMPTDAEVAKELDFQTKQNPQFMPKLSAAGLTLDDIRRDLTLDLAKEKVITKGVTETPADADAFIKANPDRFKSPEQAKLCLVQVDSAADKKLVDADLAAGKSFEDVAFQHSTAPNARTTRGVAAIQDVARIAQAQPALAELIRSTPVGKSTDWKPDGNSGKFVKIFVEQKVDAKPLTMTDAMKETVRRQLALEKGQQGTDIQGRLAQKLKTSKIEIMSKSLKPLWENAFNALKTQPAATTAPSGTATAPGAPTAPAAGAPGVPTKP